MSKITIRTGTTQPKTASRNVNISTESSPRFAEEKVDLNRTFQNDPQTIGLPEDLESNNLPSCKELLTQQNEVETRDLNPSFDDQVSPDETTLFARFVPKADNKVDEVSSKSASNSNSESTSIHQTDDNQNLKSRNDGEMGKVCAEKNVQYESHQQAINKISQVVSNVTATDSSVTDNEGLPDQKPQETEVSSDSDATAGVAMVLGSGHSPESDPNHSMLKFAVFEVQDLTEELKKLRDLLDTLSENPTDASQEDNKTSDTNVTDTLEVKFVETLNSTQSGIETDNLRPNVYSVDSTPIDVEILSNDDQLSNKMASACSKSVAIDCKTQSETSFCKGSLKYCEINEYSEEMRVLKGFNQEIPTAVI